MNNTIHTSQFVPNNSSSQNTYLKTRTLNSTNPNSPVNIYTHSLLPLTPTNSLISTPTLIPVLRKYEKLVGDDPNELITVYNLIHNALLTNDPIEIANLISYPLIGCGRCGGNIIGTPEEFITAYPRLIDDKSRRLLAAQKLEELVILDGGVMFGNGQIWLNNLCTSTDYRTCKLLIVKFMDDCQVISGWLPPIQNLAVDYSNFIFGTYLFESSKTNGDISDEVIDDIRNAIITIWPSSYRVSSSKRIGKTCQPATIEFCPIDLNLWTAESTIGELNIICNDTLNVRFDILSKNQLSFYYDSGNYVFTNKKS